MEPSPNGTNGRDNRGRFAKGNRGGPGNPYSKKIGQLRDTLYRTLSASDLRKVLRAMVQKAIEGDVAAAKLTLAYAIGQPRDFELEQPEAFRIVGQDPEQIAQLRRALRLVHLWGEQEKREAQPNPGEQTEGLLK